MRRSKGRKQVTCGRLSTGPPWHSSEEPSPLVQTHRRPVSLAGDLGLLVIDLVGLLALVGLLDLGRENRRDGAPRQCTESPARSRR